MAQLFQILVAGGAKQGGSTIEFTGSLAEAKKVIQQALVAYGAGDYIRTKYAHANVYYGEDRAECTLTAAQRLRFLVQAKYVAPVAAVYGEFVKVLGVVGKYDDSMGAYEVLTVEDSNGQQYHVSNKYDASACFRTMDNQERLEYAQKSV